MNLVDFVASKLAKESKMDEKAQAGLEQIPNFLLTVMLIGVIGLTTILVMTKLGANATITADANATAIINDTKATIMEPFDLLGIVGTMIIIAVVLGVIFGIAAVIQRK